MGLKIPLSSLFEEKEDEYHIVDVPSQEPIIENDGRMRAFPIFSFDPTRNVEIYYIELEPQCQHTSKKHLDGVEEYVFVVKGSLEMVIGTQTMILKEKQALRFLANVHHAYNNPFKEPCMIYNMVFYPKG